tara:strand:- start:99 stop:1157 length:1059 start_codon:yes stop_codon:yes gene_type:complete
MGLGKSKILSQGASGIVGTDYFNIVTYTGNGNNRDIDVGFKPDFVWIKERSDSAGYWHYLFNSIRGGNKPIFSNASNAESVNDNNGYLSSFNNDGFSITSGSIGMASLNGSGKTYVAWAWKAGGAASSNTSGTITSSVSANVAAGFSIVKYTGNGTAGATIGHGLTSLTPSLIIWKNMSATSNWLVYSPLIGNDSQFLYLNLGVAFQTSGSANEYPTNKVNPTSSVVTVNGAGSSNNINISGEDTIMYCFADIAGVQKVGSYTGSGSSGKSVTTGFRPRFLMIKGINFGNGYWFILDNQRTSGTNGKLALWANEALAESSTYDVRFDATGFTLLNTDTHLNQNYDYLYLAIA